MPKTKRYSKNPVQQHIIDHLLNNELDNKKREPFIGIAEPEDDADFGNYIAALQKTINILREQANENYTREEQDDIIKSAMIDWKDRLG